MKLPWDRQDKPDRSDGKYHRERSDQLYHSARWTRLSKRWREAHPLCERCKQNGIIKPAQCVDHVKPWPYCVRYGFDFFDERNLQSLCTQCNMEKGFEDEQKYGSQRPRGALQISREQH